MHQMFRREKDFNLKLLALRDKKAHIVKTVAMLHQEYFKIHDLLQLRPTRPLSIAVNMHPDEYPEA